MVEEGADGSRRAVVKSVKTVSPAVVCNEMTGWPAVAVYTRTGLHNAEGERERGGGAQSKEGTDS